eukprot:PLAT3664.5.p1 GENE.PLAT3664.5~~PLAT3664.5.p1  ORF type:complete len:490 (-),score=201.26 PLAT3664.5:106-1575(-)
MKVVFAAFALLAACAMAQSCKTPMLSNPRFFLLPLTLVNTNMFTGPTVESPTSLAQLAKSVDYPSYDSACSALKGGKTCCPESWLNNMDLLFTGARVAFKAVPDIALKSAGLYNGAQMAEAVCDNILPKTYKLTFNRPSRSFKWPAYPYYDYSNTAYRPAKASTTGGCSEKQLQTLESITNDLGAVIAKMTLAVFRCSSAAVGYVEGAVCLACTPDSSQYFTGKSDKMQLKLDPSSCSGVAGPCTELVAAVEELKEAAINAAQAFVNAFSDSLNIPEGVRLAINGVKPSDIPAVCDPANANTNGVMNCQDLICNDLMGAIFGAIGIELNQKTVNQLSGTVTGNAVVMQMAKQVLSTAIISPHKLAEKHRKLVEQGLNTVFSPEAFADLLAAVASPSAKRRLLGKPLLEKTKGFTPLVTFESGGYSAYAIGCAQFGSCPGANPVTIAIGVSVAVGVLLLACVAWICCRRKRDRPAKEGSPVVEEGVYMAM